MRIGKKIIKLQDSFFKLSENGSNETSIFLSHQLSQDLNLSDGVQVEFLIEYNNLFKALCFTYSFPKKLYKREGVADRSDEWFKRQSELLSNHFNGYESANYIVDVVLQTGNRRYFKGLKQASNFNIRDFLIEKHTILVFDKDSEGNRYIRVYNSLEELEDEKDDFIDDGDRPSFSPILPLQKIYFGSPGTGKSRALENFAKANNLEIIRTTFHPDTDYQSFVGGYKPVMDGQNISYQFVPQAFTKAYTKAYANLEQGYLLAIEEINRGNCASVFGDIFQCLDRDSAGFSTYESEADAELGKYLESVGLANKITLPPNLLIYATMNTSDQSLFPMDAAFKRRWEWEYVPIDMSDAAQISVQIDEETSFLWSDFIEKINKQIHEATKSDDKKLGNRFVSPKDENGKLIISKEQFVNKVMFYLWTEVYKDEHESGNTIFKSREGDVDTIFSYNELFVKAGEYDLAKLNGFLEFNGIIA